MTKLCFISQLAYPLLAATDHQTGGGAELQLYLLAKELRNRGFDISFIVDDFGQERAITAHGFTIYRVPFRYMGESRLHVLPDWTSLWNTMNSIDSDYYIIKTPRFLLGIVGLFCRFRRKKCIFLSSIDRDSDLAYLRNSEFFPRNLYLPGLALAHIVVAQKKEQRERFREDLGKNAILIKNIAPLGNGTATKRDPPNALWVGTGMRRKNPRLFLNLAEKIPEVAFRMIIAPGTDYTENREIRIRAGQLSNVEYLGFVPHREIHTYFGEASVLVNTSQTEGFPNIFLQSWAHRTPVVSLNVDPDEVICNRRLGFHSGGFAEMVEHVRRLVADRTLRKRMGENGRRYVKEEHNPEKIADQYLALFRSL